MDPLEDTLDWAGSVIGNREDFDSLEEFDEFNSSPESIISTCNIQPLGDFPPLDVEDTYDYSASCNSSNDSFEAESDDPSFSVDTESESDEKSTDESQDSRSRPEFPALRIRSIMKMDPNLHTVSREASVLMSRAAEMFIRDVAKVSWTATQVRKCTIMNRADVVAAVEPIPRFNFLADIVPYWESGTEIKSENDDSDTDQKQDSSSDANLFDYDQQHNDQQSEFFEQVSSFESKYVT